MGMSGHMKRGESLVKKDLTRNYLDMSGVWLGVILVSGSLAVLTLAGCRKQAAGPPPERPAPRVTVAPASVADVPVYLDEIGRTVAVQVVSIVPQVAGKVITASVENGAMVKKGELLFEIDSRPFQASLALAKASLGQNKAELGLAKIEFGRVAKLITGGAVSQLEYDQAQSALEVAQAKVAAGEAAVQTAELSLEYAKVYAPITGRAGVRMVDAGNVVKDNGPSMLVLQQMDPIYAEFTVTENDLGRLRGYLADQGLDLAAAAQRLTALVSIPTATQGEMAASDVAPGAQPSTMPASGREGQLTFLDNTVQPGTGTVKLRATVANADQHFWPGQFVNVRLVMSIHKNAVLIPVEAEQVGQQGRYVYVVKPDGTAEIRPITPGQRQGPLLVVDQGLVAGEQVIITGHLTVMPGGKVQVVSDTAQQAGKVPSTTRPKE